jgi:hypothetical protein
MEYKIENYLNKDGYCDYDKMLEDINNIVYMINMHRNDIKHNMSIEYRPIEAYKDDCIVQIEREYEDELNRINLERDMKKCKVQETCNHFPVIYKGIKICAKCLRELE